MIDFCIFTENKEKIKEIINKVMMKYDYIYNVKYNYIDNDDTYKIYIIDFSKNEYKINNTLKEIRYKNNDWKSMIIIISEKINKILILNFTN